MEKGIQAPRPPISCALKDLPPCFCTPIYAGRTHWEGVINPRLRVCKIFPSPSPLPHPLYTPYAREHPMMGSEAEHVERATCPYPSSRQCRSMVRTTHAEQHGGAACVDVLPVLGLALVLAREEQGARVLPATQQLRPAGVQLGEACGPCVAGGAALRAPAVALLLQHQGGRHGVGADHAWERQERERGEQGSAAPATAANPGRHIVAAAPTAADL